MYFVFHLIGIHPALFQCLPVAPGHCTISLYVDCSVVIPYEFSKFLSHISGGGFHQPVSTMLSGSAGSPFRSNSGHRAPWPPPALHTATEGKCSGFKAKLGLRAPRQRGIMPIWGYVLGKFRQEEWQGKIVPALNESQSHVDLSCA